MYSHDRTLLARLGFADPDRKTQKHDLACQYLGRRSQRERLVKLVGIEAGEEAQTHFRFEYARENYTCPTCKAKPRWSCEDIDDDEPTVEQKPRRLGGPWCEIHPSRVPEGLVLDETVVVKSFPEMALSKGEGQYKTTIGFLDVVLRCSVRLEKDGWRAEAAGRDIAVEVKITPTPWSEALRQINLYREYFRAEAWILAAAYEIPPHDVRTLKDDGVAVIHLGKKFDRWCAKRAKSGKAKPAKAIEV